MPESAIQYESRRPSFQHNSVGIAPEDDGLQDPAGHRTGSNGFFVFSEVALNEEVGKQDRPLVSVLVSHKISLTSKQPAAELYDDQEVIAQRLAEVFV